MKSGVYTLVELGNEQQFIDGTVDIPLDALVMDSLARMQFCIEVEKRWGVTVTPAGLRDYETLLELVSYVEGAHAN